MGSSMRKMTKWVQKLRKPPGAKFAKSEANKPLEKFGLNPLPIGSFSPVQGVFL